MSDDPAVRRARREPPRFRRVVVHRLERVSPRMVRVTLTGPELGGLSVELPAASVRLLLPMPDAAEFVIPSWNGNEFLMPDGRRPTLRTLTPRRVDPDNLELDVDVVVHDGGVLSGWAEACEAGDPAAISGPGRGYTVDGEAPVFLLAGDETAIPAIGQLIAAVPVATPLHVHIEISDPSARLALPDHPRATVEWHDLPTGARSGDALIEAVRAATLLPGTRVWAAGEAAAMQAIRRHLFEQRELPRAQATVRGYWKQGMSGDADDD